MELIKLFQSDQRYRRQIVSCTGEPYFPQFWTKRRMN